MSQNDIKQVAEIISENLSVYHKEMLTSDELCRYLNIEKRYLYKLTSKNEIPYYKPLGKLCFFKRTEIDEWLQQNRCATVTEIQDKALGYCMKKAV